MSDLFAAYAEALERGDAWDEMFAPGFTLRQDYRPVQRALDELSLDDVTARADSMARTFLDHCVALHVDGQLDAAMASRAKYYSTDLQGTVIDRCVQLFGGYGYMLEYPIGRLYADARVQRIYGGTNEIMKELIARNL